MDIDKAARALAAAERLLIITGAGLSADSGLPTYRGLGGLYNGATDDGVPIEVALSGPTLQRQPALCWKYLAEIGRASVVVRVRAIRSSTQENMKQKKAATPMPLAIRGMKMRVKKRGKL